VVTSYAPAIARATQAGFDVILETQQISESESVDFASRTLQADGIDAVLRIPLDLPLITTQDVETIIAADSESPSCVIVPSRDGTGTNALLRRPPTLFRSYFGPGSFEKHVAESHLAGASLAILELPRIALDIDDPEDVEELARIVPESLAYKLLIGMTS
jgi:2-phospho-L-lactate guanylyltransferase